MQEGTQSEELTQIVGASNPLLAGHVVVYWNPRARYLYEARKHPSELNVKLTLATLDVPIVKRAIQSAVRIRLGHALPYADGAVGPENREVAQ